MIDATTGGWVIVVGLPFQEQEILGPFETREDAFYALEDGDAFYALEDGIVCIGSVVPVNPVWFEEEEDEDE